MAEGLVSLVAVKLVELVREERILNLLVSDRARDDLLWIWEELRRGRGWLEEEATKGGQDEGLIKWESAVLDAAEGTEDVIDKIIVYEALRRRRGFKASIRRCIFMLNEPRARREVAKEIGQIKNKMVHEVSSRPIICREEETASNEVIGLSDHVKELVEWLMEDDPNRREICITGPPGSGKTTLALQAYNSNAVRSHFPCRAWFGQQTSNSSSFDSVIRHILKEIVKVMTGHREEELWLMSDKEVRSEIYKALEENRYLIALDINIDPIYIWVGLEGAFPNAMNGSRIIISKSHKFTPAELEFRREIWRTLDDLELRPLGEEFCQKLLSNTFERTNLIALHQEIEPLGMEIARKCGGLPSEIVSLGVLLSTKYKISLKYERNRGSRDVLDFVSVYLNYQSTNITRMISNYNSMDSRLQLCFLYCSLFPRGFDIPARRLIRLLVAEGWIQRLERTEDELEGYLQQLRRLGMFEEVQKKSSSGRVKTCRVNAVVQEFSIAKASQYNLFNISDRGYSTGVRRLSIHSHGIGAYISSNTSLPCLRSLLCFPKSIANKDKVSLHILQFKWLRVLDLEGMDEISELHEDVGELIQLRYLGLRKTSLCTLPSSLSDLTNLQTLDISHTLMQTLPPCIGSLVRLETLDLRETSINPMDETVQHLKQLRHIYMDMDSTVDGDSLDVSSLTNLRSLSMIRAGVWMESGLGKLSHLRKLGIYGDLDLCGEALLGLNDLESLRLGLEFGDPMSNIELIVSQLPNLRVLYLERRLRTLPDLHQFPKNLTKLCLKWCQLEQDPMATIGHLSTLRVLKLCCGSFTGKELACTSGGFRRLLLLELDLLDGLEELRIEGSAMPMLEELILCRCGALKMQPEMLGQLQSLKKLQVVEMPQGFNARLQSQDWNKIQHVRSVIVDGIQLISSSSTSSSSSPILHTYDENCWPTSSAREPKYPPPRPSSPPQPRSSPLLRVPSLPRLSSPPQPRSSPLLRATSLPRLSSPPQPRNSPLLRAPSLP